MKNQFLIFKSIILSFLFASCVSDNTYEDEVKICWNDFETQSLQSNDLTFDAEIMNPYNLIVRDSLLMTINQRTEKLCHIFNLNTRRKINERIDMGQGPYDMIHPFFIKSSDSLRFYEPMKSQVYTYSFADFVGSSSVIPTSMVKLSEPAFFSELSMLGENFIGSSYRPDAPCYMFGNDGKRTTSIGTYPVGPKQYSDLEIVDAYRSILTTNGRDRVILCHMFTDLIDFYDKAGNLIKRLHGPEHYYTLFNEYNDGVRIGSRPSGDYYRDAFYSPVCVDDKLFVLYNGKFVNQPGYNMLATTILVFDCDGKPLYNYQLDKGVLSIAVDGKNRKIYGISREPEYHIVEYSF